MPPLLFRASLLLAKMHQQIHLHDCNLVIRLMLRGAPWEPMCKNHCKVCTDMSKSAISSEMSCKSDHPPRGPKWRLARVFLHTPPYFLYVLAVPRPRLLILPCKLYVFRDSGSLSARSWPTWLPFGSIMVHLARPWHTLASQSMQN